MKMDKKFLTVVIGAALSAVPMLAAQAQTVTQPTVRFGGQLQAEYYNAEGTCAANGAAIFAGSGACTAGGNTASQSATGLIDNARGRFWILADEDLGGGMKAFGRLEFSVDVANSGSALTESNSAAPYDTTARTFDQRTREKYVGLSGAFGAIRLGNVHGVYKRLGGVRWDPLGATVLEARNNGAQSGSGDVNRGFAHNGFIAGAIKYESGKAFGEMVVLEALVAPHENSTVAGDAGTGNDYQIGVSVKPTKDLEIIAVISNNKAQPNLTTNFDQKAQKFGARYNIDKDHTVWFQREQLDMFNSNAASVPTGVGLVASVAVPNPVVDGTYTWLGYHGKFGKHNAVVQLGNHARDTVAGLATSYRNVAYMYNFSRTARVHVGYRVTTAELSTATAGFANSETKVLAAGLRKDF